MRQSPLFLRFGGLGNNLATSSRWHGVTLASLQQRNDSFCVIFRFRGKQHFVAIGKVSEAEAKAKAAQVEYLLLRLEQRLIELPPGIDVAEFVRFDGKLPNQSGDELSPVARKSTLATLRDRYLSTHAGAHEKTTLKTAGTHFRHLIATLGDKFPLADLATHDLQRHIERRAGLGIAPVTIKKEIEGGRAAWNWGRSAGLVGGDWPGKGLVYPKADEPPPFQTVEEIERRIGKGDLTATQKRELWQSLYLRVTEVADLLACVEANAEHAWVYPLFVTAAHTGMRRSELVRAKVTDVDFEGGSIVIRERKRVKGTRSTRRAPLTSLLRSALEAWLSVHPGGNALFCHSSEVRHSSKRSRTIGHQNGKGRATTLKGRMETVKRRQDAPGVGPLTVDECRDHIGRTLAGTKWDVVKGLHVLRHSMISCMAAAGIDQRIIDDIVGHTSEDMRKRYRHLTPAVKNQAVISVFG
jgi:integrase